MFRYEFMQIAFAVGIMLGVIIPIIGSNLVFKRLSMTGDALSHSSLAGVAIGLLAGFNPVYMAMVVSVVAALVVEYIRKKFQKYAELSLAIVMSVGVGLAAVLSSFTPINNFETFLFGSIITITRVELFITLGLFVVVLLYFVFFYKEIMFTSYNETNAKISGVPVNFINISYTVLSAITIALATKTIGALLVSSLIVLPIASSMQISKSYKQTIFIAIVFALISMVSGIVFAYNIGLKPGGTTVLVAVVILIVTMMIKPSKKLIKKITFKSKNKIKN